MAARRFHVARSAPASTPDGDAAGTPDHTPEPAVAGRTTSRRQGGDSPAEADSALARGLAGYVHAVASLLHVDSEATTYEVSDTATAYLALSTQLSVRPDRDLMLVWTERHGWALAVETTPTEPPAILAYLGADLVPEPKVVARFVTSVLADSSLVVCVQPHIAVARHDVGRRLARYT